LSPFAQRDRVFESRTALFLASSTPISGIKPMLKASLALSIAVATIGPLNLVAADETSWQDESAENAEHQLEQARAAMGDLRRFELDFLESQLDTAFATEYRCRRRLYCEESAGVLLECRPVDIGHRTSRGRPRFNTPYSLSTIKSETWLCAKGTLTVVDETQRSYQTEQIRPNSWWWARCFPTGIAHQFIPPWLDPQIDWQDLKTRYRIARARSTPTEFLVDLVPLKEFESTPATKDDRLLGSHQLLLDRRTSLPKRWTLTLRDRNRDRLILYTRFDVNPPHRELTISLTGYHKYVPPPEPPAGSQTSTKGTGELFGVAFELLKLWLF
jgi:hypothetical protein